MQIDNIRIDPWIPTVRRTTLMLMLACFGIGILIGSLTAEKTVVTQDRLTTAADSVDPAASSSSAKDGGRPSREAENRPLASRQAAFNLARRATDGAIMQRIGGLRGDQPRRRLGLPQRGAEQRHDGSVVAAPGGAPRRSLHRPQLRDHPSLLRRTLAVSADALLPAR